MVLTSLIELRQMKSSAFSSGGTIVISGGDRYSRTKDTWLRFNRTKANPVFKCAQSAQGGSGSARWARRLASGAISRKATNDSNRHVLQQTLKIIRSEVAVGTFDIVHLPSTETS